MRPSIHTTATCVLILLSFRTNAQQWLRGKVYKYSVKYTATNEVTDMVIPGVSIYNITTDKYGKGDLGGNYKIAASVGDKVTFSAIGYKSDTVIVTQSTLDTGYISKLKIYAVQLDEVSVMHTYKSDSVSRMADYSKLFNANSGVTGGNTPQNGFGIVLSPLTYFSKKEKQKRTLKRRLEDQEKEDYIDYKFSRGLVSSLTLLKGDSLTAFMYKYRPSYKYCRKASSEDIRMYVLACVKKEKKG